ncbi:MAG: aspartate/glutamate racemase family protein [Pyrinomonadaceae bacterium]
MDWGIGGVSIHKLIKERLGGVPVTYFSDTGTTPYGKMSRKELSSRLDLVIDHLKNKGVTHLIIGCNAASTAIGDLADHCIPIEGVIEPAVAMTVNLEPKDLGLIGGRRTVISGIYRRAFAGSGICLRQRIAQPLSGMIESGDVSSDELRLSARQIISPLRNCSHILLACTHYPAITELLEANVSPETRFIDPAGALIDRVAKWKLTGDGNDVFLTTGDTSVMKKAALAAFQAKLEHVKKTSI